MNATPQQVRDEVRRILTGGVLAGGRFVLREGNNLAPHTPLANTEALYHAGRSQLRRMRPDAVRCCLRAGGVDPVEVIDRVRGALAPVQRGE